MNKTVRANVSFNHPSLAALLPQYYLIRDALAGETAVKAKGELYLPKPSAFEDKTENNKRYNEYKTRAVFYNVTRRTLSGLVGQVFARPPVVELPAQLEELEKNASGEGVSLLQLSKQALKYNLAYGRCGIHVDYPRTDGTLSASDLEVKKIRPTLNLYSPLEIINWRVVTNGAEDQLSLVVLLETYVSNDDGFEMKTAAQFRALRLQNGIYTQEIWRESTPTEYRKGERLRGKNFNTREILTPTKPDGSNFDYIPFFFIGGEDNNPAPDHPSFYDLASVNMAHYRNSADHEESCYIVGQPTPVATGLTEDWVKNVLKGTLRFGSRGGIILPTGAKAELLQASSNDMIKDAMETKERQMVALGAKLVEQKVVQRTATESRQDKASELSVLGAATVNVEAAFVKAIEVTLIFANIEGTAFKFELNKDFDFATMTAEDRRQVVEEWQKGAITFKEMRNVLRKAGTATEDDEKAKEEINNEQAEALRLTAEAMGDNEGNEGDEGNGEP